MRKMLILISVMAITTTSLYSQVVKRDTLVVIDEWSNESEVARGIGGRFDVSANEVIFNNSTTTSTVQNEPQAYSSTTITTLGKAKKNRSARTKYYRYDDATMVRLGLSSYMLDGAIYSQGQTPLNINWGRSKTIYITPISTDTPLVKRWNIGLITALGLEYQNFKFDDKYSIVVEDENNDLVSYAINSDYKVKRSSLKNLYLTLPVLLKANVGKLKLQAGVVGAMRLHSKTKVVYYDEGEKYKAKNSDDFNFQPFKVDGMVELGMDNLSIFCNYSLTDTFVKSSAEELRTITIGLGFGF